MSEDVRARSLDAFIEDLNRIRKAAGPPSYGRLESLSRRLENQGASVCGVRVITLAKSTANDILTGVRRDRPKWEWVASYWAVLRLIAEQGGMDPGRLGPLEAWRRRYEAIDGTGPSVPEPEPEPEPGTGTRSGNGVAWWSGGREVVPEWFETYLGREPAAGLIRLYEPHAVPALLQTEEYARHDLRARHPGDPPALHEHRVDLRMRRQEILRRPDPPRLWAVIEERALRAGIGNARVTRAQLERLVELWARPHITIQVMPSAPGGQLAGDGPVSLLRFAEDEVPDLVYLEQSTYALYPDRPQDVNHYLQVLNRLAIEAGPPAATPGAIRRILAGLEHG
ncbi:DUF5753 domain-containing protein [Actinomadura sp. 9N407]|uniref:DUF5753 domain-containing protein n=1 Tax=Actinomadura sp. 9N407 TaxID=3375154 RepID=UPI0037A533BC